MFSCSPGNLVYFSNMCRAVCQIARGRAEQCRLERLISAGWAICPLPIEAYMALGGWPVGEAAWTTCAALYTAFLTLFFKPNCLCPLLIGKETGAPGWVVAMSFPQCFLSPTFFHSLTPSVFVCTQPFLVCPFLFSLEYSSPPQQQGQFTGRSLLRATIVQSGWELTSNCF